MDRVAITVFTVTIILIAGCTGTGQMDTTTTANPIESDLQQSLNVTAVDVAETDVGYHVVIWPDNSSVDYLHRSTEGLVRELLRENNTERLGFVSVDYKFGNTISTMHINQTMIDAVQDCTANASQVAAFMWLNAEYRDINQTSEGDSDG